MPEFVKGFRGLSLLDAIKTGRVGDFIKQEESLSVGPVDARAFEAVIKAAATPPQLADRTSRSPSPDGSRGKRTR